MEKNNQNHKMAQFALNTLAASMLLVNSAHALQSLDDTALRQVNGQDGIHLSTSYDEINVKQFYWEDNAGIGSTGAPVIPAVPASPGVPATPEVPASSGRTKDTLRAIAEDFKIEKTNANVTTLPVANRTPGTDYKINIGSGSGADAGKTGLDLEVLTNPTLMSIQKFKICDTEAAIRCSEPVGSVAIQTSSVIDIKFNTRDGLFSKDKQATLDLGFKNANIYLGQKDVNNELNQLILKNMNFNFLGKGVMFVDAVEGFKLQTNTDGTAKAAIVYNTNGTINQLSSDKPSATRGYVDFRRTLDSASATLKNTGSYGNGDETADPLLVNGDPNPAHYGTETTNAGLNLEFMLNKNVTNTNNDTRYALDGTTNSPTGAKGLIRVGASGRMVNGFLQLRGMSSYTDNDNNATALANPVYNTATGEYGNPNNSNIVGKTNNSSTNLNQFLPTPPNTPNPSYPLTATIGNNIIGKSGIAFRMAAEFTKDSDPMLGLDGQATTLEIGGAGLNTYGFEFGNLTGLLSKDRGSFDSGNVYINLADTKTVLLPANKEFQTTRFGNGNFLTNNNDYIQYIYTDAPTGILRSQNPYSLLIAVRGAEFQAVSRRGRFTNSARTKDLVGAAVPNIKEHDGRWIDTGTTDVNGDPIYDKTTHKLNEWGLALPFYNLNANAAIFGTTVDAATVYTYTSDYNGGTTGKAAVGTGQTPRLGFSLAMSTQGVSDDGSKTTSIMVVDGKKITTGTGVNEKSQPTDYYVGLRNIDMLLKGTGSIGVEKGSFNVSLKNMLMVMSAQVAAGYLPGTTYKTCFLNSSAAGCSIQDKALDTSFKYKDDVLFGVKLRAGGEMNFSLIPNSEYQAASTSNGNVAGGRMNIVGDFTLDKAQGNTIQISDPLDGSTLGLDNLQGKLAFNNAIVIAPDQRGTAATNSTYGEGVVSFNSTFTFNPDRSIDGVFRARDINLYPPTSGAGARLGELAITGGRLSSQFSIIPRN